MIAYLTGIITDKTGPVIVECNGVGYEVRTPALDLTELKIEQKAKLYIYEQIKEDVYDLYGFVQKDTKYLFEQLLGVKNVGPKVALAILDIGSSDLVRQAIAQGDIKTLQTAKGVGKRAAEQVVVELRDRVGAPVGDGAESLIVRAGINQSDEAVQALISLGYTDADAQNALQNIDPTLSVEERIKQALKG